MTPKLGLVLREGSKSRSAGFCRPEGSLLVRSAISSHLLCLGYPEKSIISMNKCGLSNGFYLNRSCGCGLFAVPMTHHCNLAICPRCSKLREWRIFKRYFPFFDSFNVTKMDFFQFLTISPKNYGNLGEAFKDVRYCFSKFLRRKYLKERIKAGFYVLETKQSEDGSWNVHIHAVLYGRWLDYRIRGRCMDCNQNLLKYNKYAKKFYCANRKCGSDNIIRFKDTKLNREWAKSSGSSAHIYGERVGSSQGAISYLTKYISVNKDNFLNDKSIAEYIFYTRKRRLISSFGKFYDIEIGYYDFRIMCPHCKSYIDFFIDYEVSHLLNKPPDERAEGPRDLTSFCT